MAGMINLSSDKAYISNLKATADTPNGIFVKPNYANGTASAVKHDGVSTEGDEKGLLFVNNVNPYIHEELVADSDFVVKQGEYLRLKALKVGDIFTTDQFTGTYANINVDDVMCVVDGGKVGAIDVRTPAITFKVIEKTKIYGKDALKLVVLSD